MLQGFSGAGYVYQPHPGGVRPGRSRRLISSGNAQCATAAAATSAALRGALIRVRLSHNTLTDSELNPNKVQIKG